MESNVERSGMVKKFGKGDEKGRQEGRKEGKETVLEVIVEKGNARG